jgi:hypothetical protein
MDPVHEVNMLQARSHAGPNVDHERMERERVFGVEVVAVEEISSFLVDLFAYGEE